MDERLDVKDLPRQIVSGVNAETPLLTLAWRALKAEHRNRSEERKNLEDEARRIVGVLAGVAEQSYRLRRAAQALSTQIENLEESAKLQELFVIANELEDRLGKMDISVVAPLHEPFAGELMELFENVAQKPESEIEEPRIEEIISPAIVCRGAVLRMGKAIIAVPTGRNEE